MSSVSNLAVIVLLLVGDPEGVALHTARGVALRAKAGVALHAKAGVALHAEHGVARPAASVPLRVCADPNNLPFSNDRREGFENKIAEIVARDLGRTVEYFWTPQRRGFIRNTLKANACDVVVGVPSAFDAVRPTKPYYRSTYVFVSRGDRALHLRSLDDPRLKQLLIGIQITGDDYDNPPAAQALASRQIIQNVRGYTVYGDYSRPNPPRGLIDAVASGAIDVAVAWGPLAGYFARREPVVLEIAPVSPQADSRFVRFVFDISMGVRRDDQALAAALDAAIVRRQTEIRRVLVRYGVPLVETAVPRGTQ
jgi:quinoprotein dehydrogenase-associated probable ABC transporter substrate-binding protein